MKKLVSIRRQTAKHWVGDGFPVRTMFSYSDAAAELSPFLLLDYAGPAEFAPSDKPRGVEQHPHRGFETVTIVYSGEVEHRDSAGGGGKIGAGDVQWMTAAAGLVHEEMHSRDFTRQGGTFEVVQLWVNLPARHKSNPPGYQSITDIQIPRVPLPDDAGSLRVIAGTFGGTTGPARTFTPVNLWDARLLAGHRVTLPVASGQTTALFVLSGRIEFDDDQALADAELGLFERSGEGVAFKVMAETKLLVLGGQPIDEPIVGSGPFVMNTRGEIQQAYEDFRAGRLGQIRSAQ